MNKSMTLAEMANNTNYASMNYYQLVELDLAFTWAREIIKSLLPIKKQEEMEALSRAYFARNSIVVNSQEVTAIAAEEKVNDRLIEGPSLGDNRHIGAQNNDPVILIKKNNTSMKKALDKRVMEKIKEIPLGDNIDPSAPYYVCYEFKNPKGGDLLYTRTGGWNAPPEVVEMLKTKEKMYMEERLKSWTSVVGDYNIYHIPGGWIRVSYFKSTGEYKGIVPNVSELPKEVQDIIKLHKEIDQIFDERYAKDAAVTGMKEETLVEKSETKPSIKSPKKDPRCIAIVGTKGGETKRWNSFRACERDLGVGFGCVSQFFSGKMKSVKGWKLEKAAN